MPRARPNHQLSHLQHPTNRRSNAGQYKLVFAGGYKAFRSPSLINNYLQTTIVNRIDLAQINPAFAGLPGRNFAFPVNAFGNERLKEESNQSYELVFQDVLDACAASTTLARQI